MKQQFNILLKLKLGCHKNNKNVKKISAMLKKYPKETKSRIFETCFKSKKKNGRILGLTEENGTKVYKYTNQNEYYARKIVFKEADRVLGEIKIIDVGKSGANSRENHHILL